MKLLLDIGNTLTKWSLVSDDQTFDIALKLSIQSSLSSTFIEQLPSASTLSSIICSSVLSPEATEEIKSALLNKYSNSSWHLLNGASALTFISNPYQEPLKLGSDRRAMTIATTVAYPHQRTLIISAGTTTTIDIVDQHSHLGGWILPGPTLMTESLVGGTANLPHANSHDMPLFSLGQSTTEGIKQGVLAALLGALPLMLGDGWGSELRDRKSVV